VSLGYPHARLYSVKIGDEDRRSVVEERIQNQIAKTSVSIFHPNTTGQARYLSIDMVEWRAVIDPGGIFMSRRER
jgi:hypothetical protein